MCFKSFGEAVSRRRQLLYHSKKKRRLVLSVKNSNKILLILLAVLLTVPVLLAQNISSTIIGLITDASGASVPEAQVTVTN